MSATPTSMLHIVTRGLQDIERLNPPRGQPTVDFYVAVIRRRTRWASQWRRVEFDNLADFGRKATVTLPILGELITRATLVVDLPDIYGPQKVALDRARADAPCPPAPDVCENSRCLIGPYWSWTNGIGNAICSNVEFSIGGTVIDRLDSRLIEVLDEQTNEVEHWDSTNAMIARNPTNYTQFGFLGEQPTQQRPQTLEIVFPFWWNRGPGPQALPIQALAKDKVQITVDFRQIQECIYTDARVNPANPGAEASQPGPMPQMAGCGFYQLWPEDEGGVPIYDMTRTGFYYDCVLGEIKTPYGRVLPGVTMPAANKWHFRDAYWVVEYVSLEDREASAYRMADLQIPIEQHVAVPVTETKGAQRIRIPLAQSGLVREMSWVAQHENATDYNAYFLFSRDLAAPGATPSEIPWWPDAIVPDWDYGNGYMRPGFADRLSDPIVAATLWYRGVRRFEHEGPSFFRSLLPALSCRRTPLIDRYIYRYDFGFWPTGGLSETLDFARDEVRGFANWDKIPNKEFAITMNQDDCEKTEWEVDDSQQAQTYGPDTLRQIELDFATTTTAFQVELIGAGDGIIGTRGRGAYVKGIVDYQALRRLPTFGNLRVRTNAGGSAALVVTPPITAPPDTPVTWVAVAASGGQGTGLTPSLRGGDAGSAVEIGWQGSSTMQTHAAAFGGTAITYTNEVLPSATATSYGAASPVYTVTGAGTISEWQIYTAVWSSVIKTFIYKNGVKVDEAWVSDTVPVSAATIKWRSVGASTPISVVPGDTIYITHSSLETFRLYQIGRNPASPVNPFVSPSIAQGAIVKFTVAVGGGVRLGGGGGGRLQAEGVGQIDGQPMLHTQAFALSHTQTGGATEAAAGGDGYYGGGSGNEAGGGGGSHVSRWISAVDSALNPGDPNTDATVILTPLRLVRKTQPSYNIYIWLTRYNMLRINNGHGVLMFSE